jgi:hypothetical protein
MTAGDWAAPTLGLLTFVKRSRRFLDSDGPGRVEAAAAVIRARDPPCARQVDHAFGCVTARVERWLRMQYILKYSHYTVVYTLCYGFSASKKD